MEEQGGTLITRLEKCAGTDIGTNCAGSVGKAENGGSPLMLTVIVNTTASYDYASDWSRICSHIMMKG